MKEDCSPMVNDYTAAVADDMTDTPSWSGCWC